jgi:hypothetical protein
MYSPSWRGLQCMVQALWTVSSHPAAVGLGQLLQPLICNITLQLHSLQATDVKPFTSNLCQPYDFSLAPIGGSNIQCVETGSVEASWSHRMLPF